MHVPESGVSFTNRIADLLGSSVKLITEYRCECHPHKTAVSLCEICRADICGECANIRSRRIICSKCMGALDKAFAGAGPASFFKRLFTHPFFLILVIVVFLAYLFFVFAQGQRKGLLGSLPANGEPSEEQVRLRLILYAQKANRIEIHADALRESGRPRDAIGEYDRARAVYEMLAPEAAGRWESSIIILARARLLKQMGERSYAEGLYKSLETLPEPDKAYPAMAQFYLAKLQEETDPNKALETYENFLRSLTYVPDSLSLALNVVAHTQGAYNYASRLRAATRTDFNFEGAKVEALLEMGRLLLRLGRPEEVRDNLSLAVEEGAGTKLGEQAKAELNKIRAIEKQNRPPVEKIRREEKVVITHFE